MIRSKRGSAYGYFLVALLGAVIGGLMVVTFMGKRDQSSALPQFPTRTASTAVPTPATGAGSVEDAVRRAGPAVVSIKTRMMQAQPQSQMPDLFRQFFGEDSSPMPQEGQGSGMIIDARKGYVLTNAHVVKDAQDIKVTLPDKRTFDGRVVGTDPQSDIAVVRIPARKLPQVMLSHEKAPAIGSWVVAIGNPFGFANTVTVGVVSATERDIAPQDGPKLEQLIQTDAAINPGNSGGPLCNLKGEVVGINTAILSVAQGIGFSISADHAQTIAQQLIEQGKVVRPWIGVAFREVTPDLRDYFGLSQKEGVLVIEVVEGSPAAKAGLQRGDLVVEIDHKQIKKLDDLKNEVLKHKVGDTVNLLVYRKQESRVFKLRTAEMPQNMH